MVGEEDLGAILEESTMVQEGGVIEDRCCGNGWIHDSRRTRDWEGLGR